jgi:phosphoribosyl 1,2-cyclic phosphodiesterase
LQDRELQLVVWGTRGSIPSAPDDPSIFGARTSCVEIRAGGRRLVFDAGSGIVELGLSLLADPGREIDLFLSHAHYDHMMGLPYFAPLYYPDFAVRLHAGHMLDGTDCESLVTAYMSPPFHPVTPKVFRAAVAYRTFTPGDDLSPASGLGIATHRLNHPNGAVAYRVSWNGRSIVYATDTEHEPGQPDVALRRFVAGADILVYDTTFTDAEMETFRGYGHSSVEEGVRICRDAGIARLVLFHHSHKRTDAQLLAIEAGAQRLFAGAVAARPGLSLVAGAPLPSQSRFREPASAATE